MTQAPTPLDVGALVRAAGESMADQHDLASGAAVLRRRLDVDERRNPPRRPTPAWRQPAVLGAAAGLVLLAVLVWALQIGSAPQPAPPGHGSPPTPTPTVTVTTALPVGVWSGPVGQQASDIVSPGHSVILRVNPDGTGSYDLGFVVPFRVTAAGIDTVTLVDSGHVQGRDVQCHDALGTYRVRLGSGGTITLVRTAAGPCASVDDLDNVLGQITFRPS